LYLPLLKSFIPFSSIFFLVFIASELLSWSAHFS